MTPDERRAAWERSIDAKLASGHPVETDPIFLSWIDEWIAGTTTMTEVSKRYATLLGSRRSPTKVTAATKTILQQILNEFPDIQGISPREPAERARSTNAIARAWSDED